MCLYIDKVKTEQEQECPSKPLWGFFKAFVRKEGYLITPYMKYRVDGPNRPIIAPEKENLNLDINKGMVGAGVFHARTLKGALKQDLFWIDQFELGFCVIVEVIVQAKNIVAYGNQDNVAFTKYEIATTEWDKVFESKKPALLKDL